MTPEQQATRTAVVETLRYLADGGRWTPTELRQMAAGVALDPLFDYSVCPVCEEVECDGACPLRTLREAD